MAASSRPVECRHFDVILLKSTAAILAAAMLVGDRTTASTSATLLAGSAAVAESVGQCWLLRMTVAAASRGRVHPTQHPQV